jgi:2-hydroxychromene-2-carboxylate isomerase
MQLKEVLLEYPLFFADDEIFFGKDSLGDLEEFITK